LTKEGTKEVTFCQGFIILEVSYWDEKLRCWDKMDKIEDDQTQEIH